MKDENDDLLKGLSGGGEVEGGSPLFSVFQPAPAPAPVPAPPSPSFKVPAPPEKAPAPQPSQDKEMVDYLKAKISDMEAKLRESQEKGLAFAYELKGREEARKESRREMEEFLAGVKRQQTESESKRSHDLELEKAKARIESLELKIVELSTTRPATPAEPEQPAEEIEKLRAGLRKELAADLELLGEKLTRTILKETVEPLAAMLTAENSRGLKEIGSSQAGLKEALSSGLGSLETKLTDRILQGILPQLTGLLAAESAAREMETGGLRQLAGSMSDKVSRLESSFSAKLAELDALFTGFSSRLKAETEAAGKGNEELRALVLSFSVEISEVKGSMTAGFGQVNAVIGKYRSDLRNLSAGMETFRKETSGGVEGLRRVIETGSGEAAGAAVRRVAASLTAAFGQLASDEVSDLTVRRMAASLAAAFGQLAAAEAATAAARRVAQASVPYDLGFITACLDNMEKAFCAAKETLARTSADASRAAGSPGADAAFIARRQAAILDSAVRDLGAALEVFRGVRQEALEPIKKILGS